MKKRIKSIIPAMLFLILFLTFVSASQSSLGVFKINSQITLKQNCNCTFVNVTSVLLPNGTQIQMNNQMVQVGTDFYYPFNQTNVLGSYIVMGNSDKGIWAYDFEITQTGYKQTTSEGIGSAIYLFLILALTVLFGFLGFKFVESDTLWIIGIFLIALSLLFVVYDVWLGYEYNLNYVGGNNGSVIPQTLFYIFMTVLVAGLMTSLILLVTKWKKVKEWIKKALKEDKEDQEDDDDWDNDKF